MKKLTAFVGIALGTFGGLLASIDDKLSVRIGLMLIGALIGLVFGGALSQAGRKGQTLRRDSDVLAGLGVTPEDIARNYWRDKGRPPLTSPLEPEHGIHQFDPDKF